MRGYFFGPVPHRRMASPSPLTVPVIMPMARPGAAPTPAVSGGANTSAPSPRRPPATFHVSELMVRPKWRKEGLGARLHGALLDSRTEALACLTVDTKRPRLQALYESWGCRRAGEQQPFADPPLYAVMLRTA
jgi:GNAT superfamily N-acetyltransferase